MKRHASALIICITSVSLSLHAGPQEDAQLLEAVRMNQIDTIKDLILNKGANVNVVSLKDLAPLMAAASNNNVDLIRFYLEHGADVNAKSDYGMTAIMWAVINGSKEAVKELLENSISKSKIDLSITTKRGKNVLDYATDEGNPEIVALIDAGKMNQQKTEQAKAALLSQGIQPSQMVDALRNAILRNDGKQVELLLDAGVDINGLTGFNMLPLSLAIQNDRIEIAKMLIERGANLVFPNKQTALHVATLMNFQGKPVSKDLIEFIVKKAPEIINLRDNSGKTALYYLMVNRGPSQRINPFQNVQNDRYQAVQMLQQAGAQQ